MKEQLATQSTVTKDSAPLISVIIPTYNRGAFIKEAVDSVFAQTYKNTEVIIIDDGSTDNTKEIIASYKDRVYYQYKTNSGITATRNKGLELATGKYVAFLDSDDVWLPNKLEEQLKIIEKDENVGMVCSMMENIDENGVSYHTLKPKIKPGDTVETLILNGSALTSTYLLRRNLLDKVGLFDRNVRIFEDLDLVLRFAEVSKVVNIDQVLALYRYHNTNVTQNENEVYYQRIIFAKKWFLRCKQEHLRAVLKGRIRHYSFMCIKDLVKKGRIIKLIGLLFELLGLKIRGIMV